mmetsp:Transcript_850/g.2874  ORF Transcript_850/g.2874 Transcript_850/m.2874 type:complete len:137 (+) Transcript_850:14-424(+)
MMAALVAAWGLWRTYQAVGGGDEKPMLKFWAVYACYVTYDSYGDWVVRWLPFARLVKLVSVGALFLSPRTLRATDVVFDHLLPLASLLSTKACVGLLYVLTNVFHKRKTQQATTKEGEREEGDPLPPRRRCVVEEE